MTLMYFAWLKQKIGMGEEELTPHDNVVTVADLIDWLCSRGDNFATAFEDRDVIRVAINQEFAELDDPIAGAAEIAFFPPVTGGQM